MVEHSKRLEDATWVYFDALREECRRFIQCQMLAQSRYGPSTMSFEHMHCRQAAQSAWAWVQLQTALELSSPISDCCYEGGQQMP